MASLQIAHRRIIIASVFENDRSHGRTIPFWLLGAAPSCQKSLKIRKAAGVSAVPDIVEQVPRRPFQSPLLRPLQPRTTSSGTRS